MKESPVPLTALSEAQRAQAQTRFAIIRPALEDGISQAQVARSHTIPASPVRGWVKRYRERGLAGLADRRTRSDKGKSRQLPADAITLIEGLALRPPAVRWPPFIGKSPALPSSRAGLPRVMLACAKSSRTSTQPW